MKKRWKTLENFSNFKFSFRGLQTSATPGIHHLHPSIRFRSFSSLQCQIHHAGGFTLSVKKQVNFYYVFTLGLNEKSFLYSRVESGSIQFWGELFKGPCCGIRAK